MKKLKLGIIGFNEGNGHPYSWAAICNGYNPEHMKNGPFPDIYKYLSERKFPNDSIEEANVTHIWTQDKLLSENIAIASNIENIVDRHTDLIGEVDAVLLARDDAELHYEMSAPFLKAGIPVYIDKPFAIEVKVAEKMYSMEKYPGQIFTCSALRYAQEFMIDDNDVQEIGAISHIDACSMKNWDRYGVHIIEPVLNIIGEQGGISKISNVGTGERDVVVVNWGSGLKTTFSTFGKIYSPISIRVFGKNGYKVMTFVDSFSAFRTALQTFIDVVLKRQDPPSREFVMNVVNIIEKGKKKK